MTPVTIRAPFLTLSYTGVGIEGGCPAEKIAFGSQASGTTELNPARFEELRAKYSQEPEEGAKS